MRRFFLIFFIFALPLQFTWAASARYCAHENAVSVSHFGHHAHAHKATASDSCTAASQSGYDDPDCGYCHFSCSSPLAQSAASLSLAPRASYAATEPVANRYRVPESIDRPNWLLAV